MFAYLLLGIGLLIGLLLVGRWFVTVEPRAVLKAAKWVGLAAAGGLALLLAVTGRLGMVITAAVVLAPWLFRWIEQRRRGGGMAGTRGGSARGGSSQVASRFLQMTLDHASGALDGAILAGAHAGCQLSTLDLPQLLDLLATYRRQDAPSALLLESFLDRHHPGWRQGATASGPDDVDPEILNRGRMSREEAYRILGLAPGAGDDEILRAHRRLIAGLHPDRGGSPILAALVNAARDVLLRS